MFPAGGAIPLQIRGCLLDALALGPVDRHHVRDVGVAVALGVRRDHLEHEDAPLHFANPSRSSHQFIAGPKKMAKTASQKKITSSSRRLLFTGIAHDQFGQTQDDVGDDLFEGFHAASCEREASSD